VSWGGKGGPPRASKPSTDSALWLEDDRCLGWAGLGLRAGEGATGTRVAIDEGARTDTHPSRRHPMPPSLDVSATLPYPPKVHLFLPDASALEPRPFSTPSP